MAIDEWMDYLSSGVCNYIFYFPDKPGKRGLKFEVLAEPDGYLVQFFLDTRGADGTSNTRINTFSRLLKAYIDANEIGKVIYCDSAYNWVACRKYVVDQGFGIIGTARENTTQIDEEVKSPCKKKLYTNYLAG